MPTARKVPPFQHRWINVDGMRTHYLDAGSGPTVVLVHSGEFGASAELSWEHVIGPLAQYYRVLALDLLGYGATDKLHDFVSGHRRRLAHLTRFLELLDVTEAAFIGNSMGGTLLARIAATEEPIWPIRALVLASGGGFIPDNESRRRILGYDCTLDSMRDIVSVLFHDPRFSEDDVYVARRHESAMAPGAWECASAARFKSPAVPPRSEFGQADDTRYELIAVPTLVIAGGEDRLREPGYADEIAGRIADAVLRTYESCGHMPNIEHAPRFVADALEFLLSRYPVA